MLFPSFTVVAEELVAVRVGGRVVEVTVGLVSRCQIGLVGEVGEDESDTVAFTSPEWRMFLTFEYDEGVLLALFDELVSLGCDASLQTGFEFVGSRDGFGGQ